VKLKISEIVIGDRRRPLGDISALASSIKEIGLQNPVVVTEARSLVSGRHRIAACTSLGWEEIPVVVVKLDALRAELAEIDENLIRNELTVLERSEHLKRRKEIYEALHPQAKHGGDRRSEATKIQKPDLEKPPAFVEATAAATGRSRSAIAEEVQIATSLPEEVKEALRPAPSSSVSAPAQEALREVTKSKTELLTLARQEPEKQREIVEKISKGEAVTVREAVAQVRREERVEKIAEISRGNAPLPTDAPTKFPILCADPPWRYEHVKTENRAIENQYPTMSLEEICALPVGDLATPDAVLYLWTTAPKLEEAFAVLKAWGFTYRTSIVWDKELIGMGYWVRVQHEHLLIATRGAPPTPLPENRSSSLLRVRRGEHSAKPVEFYELIEKAHPEFAKVELFCRSPREGWTAWGNQASGQAA
jgi:N6-adenosine-specific RNA methylase IME4/ParB-like chromosome segregation protein Spo0J